MPSLGNQSIARKRDPRIQIRNPKAAGELLDLALDCAKRRQRAIFFCQCEYPCEKGKISCHRAVVASLVLKEARKRGIEAEIVEWPGGLPGSPIELPVTESEATKIKRGKASVDLGPAFPIPAPLALPSRSIAKMKSTHENFLAAVDAAKHRRGGWFFRSSLVMTSPCWLA
jgi:hypothetical protein